MKKRIFIAINFPDQVKNEIAKIQQDFDHQDFKMVSSENLHLTLAFLGYLEENRLAEIEKIIQKHIASHDLFDIDILDIGCFPHENRPKVVWLGIKSDKLINIANKLMMQLKENNFKLDDRPFSPHLTILRNRQPKQETTKFINGLLPRYKNKKFAIIKVESIEIMESKLFRSGPKYSIYKSIKLQGK